MSCVQFKQVTEIIKSLTLQMGLLDLFNLFNNLVSVISRAMIGPHLIFCSPTLLTNWPAKWDVRQKDGYQFVK